LGLGISEVRRAVAVAAKAGKFMFYYVYILQSEIDQEKFYTGFTEDLETRLKSHNSGGCYHTSKYKPWHIKTAVAFGDRQKALDFKKYLKSPSGRGFAKKRF
jgi:predicted GIY-YIG superfamily endonuclease